MPPRSRWLTPRLVLVLLPVLAPLPPKATAQTTAVNRNQSLDRAQERVFDQVIADYTEAIRLDPRNTDAYLARGCTWAAKGEHDKAIADYTEAIRLDPRCAEAYAYRGCAYAAKGEHDKGIADLTEAVRLDPTYVDAYRCRGDAWAAKGDQGKADSDYRQADLLKKKS